MEQQTFFPGSSRRVIIGSPTKQASNGRICVPITMPLDDGSFVGMPDWLSNAYEQVSKYCSYFEPQVQQIADTVVHFQNDKPKGEMFEMPNAKIPNAELKKLEVLRAGEEDEPDVELHFKLFSPFAREFWEWLGEMAGHEVYMAFPSSLGGAVKVVAPKQETLLTAVETAEAPDSAEAEILASDSKPVDESGPGSEAFEKQVRESLGAPEPFPAATRVVDARDRGTGKKSGPSDLKKYHEQQQDKERGRGRSRMSVN